MSEPQISIVCAMDKNRLIGNNNQLPWHLPADLALFKKTTLGKPIIMGRKTFDSIGKALPGRQNIIITSNQKWTAEGCDIAYSIDQAIDLAGDSTEVMLIGGASLYQQTIDRAANLYITLINGEFSGDTWFPEINQKLWRVATEVFFEADSKNLHSFLFTKFIREKN